MQKCTCMFQKTKSFFLLSSLLSLVLCLKSQMSTEVWTALSALQLNVNLELKEMLS